MRVYETEPHYKKKPAPLELINYRMQKAWFKYREEEKKRPNLLIWFDSVSDLINCVEENVRTKSWTNEFISEATHKEGSGSRWAFGADYRTYQATKDALIFGKVLPNAYEKMEAAREKIMDDFPELYELHRQAMQSRRRKIFSEDGAELDIDRYMCGDPAYWMDRRKVKDKKVIKLLFNSSMSWDIDANEFFENCVLVTVFIEIMEAMNLPCEIYYAPISWRVSSRTDTTVCFVKLKDADVKFDSSLMLSAGVPGLFRYFVLKAEANILPGQIKQGLGSPWSITPSWIMDTCGFDIAANSTGKINDRVTTFTTKIKSLMS